MNEQLLRLIDAATGAGHTFAGIDLGVVCATSGVAGLGDGLYRHDGITGGLEPVSPGPIDLGDIVPGVESTGAQAVVIVLGALSDAVDRRGERGYHLLLVAAGIMTAALADRAGRAALPCCQIAQVYPEPLRDLAGVDGYRWVALSAVVLGRLSPSADPLSLQPPKGGEIQ